MYKNRLAARLLLLRMQKGVSPDEMSLALGQKKDYIAKIERQRTLPSMEIFFDICSYLDATPQEFFIENKLKDELLEKMMDELKTLTHDDLTLVYTCIRRFFQNRKEKGGCNDV